MENNKLFVYGILKRGYALDLANEGAKFIGEAYIQGATLYGIGPYWVAGDCVSEKFQKKVPGHMAYHGVGLRLEDGNVAHGELWEIPDGLWNWLDGIEQNGHCYTRKIVPVIVEQWKEPIKKTEAGLVSTMAALERINYIDAWVYEHTYPEYKYEHPIEGGKF